MCFLPMPSKLTNQRAWLHACQPMPQWCPSSCNAQGRYASAWQAARCSVYVGGSPGQTSMSMRGCTQMQACQGPCLYKLLLWAWRVTVKWSNIDLLNLQELDPKTRHARQLEALLEDQSASMSIGQPAWLNELLPEVRQQPESRQSSE